MKKVYLILITGLIFLLGWMPANAQTYCTSGSTSLFDTEIHHVILHGDTDTIDNLTVGQPNLYTYYNLLSADISGSNFYTVTVLLGTTGTTQFGKSAAVYIDWNNDGDFEDPNEFIGYIGPFPGGTVPTPVSLTFDIPGNAVTGVTRLRVVCAETTVLSTLGPCNMVTWGETEDYNIEITSLPACPNPLISGVSNLTNSTADVDFVANPNIVALNVEWGPTGFTPGTGSVSLTTTSPFTITGLTQNTTYDVYIQGICQDTLSSLVGPVTFTSLPDNLLIFTYSGGDIPTIEENPVNPNNITACSDTMTVNLPNGLWVTSVDVYYNMTAQNGAFMSEQRTRIWSPTSNTGEPGYFIGTGGGGTFSYARTGLNYWNMMFGEVEFIMDAKRTWSNFNSGPGCHTLDNFVVNNTWEMHITLDTMPDCIFPFNVQATTLDSSALITWMDNPTAVAFNWEYGPAGYTQGTGSLGSGLTVADSVLLTGLSPETAYDFYVQSICGPDGNSMWIGPISFETKCNFLAAGTYTLGNATADFLDFADLVEYLLCGGLGGPVIIDVIANSGPFEEQATFPVFAGASSTNTLTINGNNNILQYNPSVTDSRHTLALNGASYMTFNDLHVKTLGTGAFGWAVHLRNNADHNTFNNCTFEVDLAMTGFGFSAFVVGSSLTSATIAGQAAHNLTITNSEFIGGYYGLALNGPTAAPFSQDYHIENNVIRDFHLYGVWLRGLENAVIDRNDIYRDQRTNITTFYGIYGINGMPGTMITNNRIHSPYGSITPPGTALMYGTFFTTMPGTETNPWYFINNQIYNTNTNGTVYGIYTTGATDHFRVYHNSISIVNTTAGGFGAVRAGWFASGSLNAEVMNNIFHVNSTNTGAKYAVYVNSPAGYDIDHNVINNISPSGNSFIANISFSDIGTFEAWQDAGFDENGINVNPIFTNEMNDLMPQLGAIKGIGANLTAVAPLDFDGVQRPSDPDPGVYQFEVDSCAAPFIVNITPGDTFAIVSWVPNVATALWHIEYGPAGYTVGTGMFATTTETSFTINGLLPETSYDVYVRPDCGADSQWGDAEPFSTLCLFLLEGTYTLGNATADFEDFTALVDYFNCGGVAGPVIIEVIPNSGPFEEQVILPFIPGSSEVNTITIMGNNNTLEYLSTTTNERATLKLNGTKHMTFKHMHIKALGTTTGQWGYGVQLMNNADYNTFDSCTIEVTDLLTSLNYAGFVASNSPTSPTIAGNPANHLTITNCEIIGGYYGLSISGPTTAPWLQNNVITNNIIRDFYLYGVYWRGNANSLIDGNDINRATRQGPISTFYGIFSLSGMDNTYITNNRIHNSLGINSSSPAGQYGLYFSGASGSVDNPYYVYNNMIYNLRTTGFSGGIYMFNPNHFRMYHNTISLSNDQTTGSSTFYGVYISGNATNSEVKNNIVSMDLAFGGTKYLMYFTSMLNETVSNNNAFDDGNSGGTTFFGNFGGFGNDISTFADWQALGLDSNSVYAGPFFVNPLNNLTPQSSSISQIGTDLTDIAPLDIFGVVRGETPDPGAIEFEPASCLAPSALTISDVTFNSAEFSWTDNTPVGDMWLIEIGPAGFTPTGIPTDTAYTQPYLITGLSEITSYDVYILVVCDANESSAWSGPVTFTTFPEFAVVVTYDSGVIPSIYEVPTTMATISPCAGEMTVQIPEGFWITTVDVSYDMTATGGSFMSEQRSRLMVPALNITEPQYYQGVGTGGVWSYERTGLDLFAMLTGEITFVLDAKRIWCTAPAGICSADCIYVNNNTWTLVIGLQAIPACPDVQSLQVDSVAYDGAQVSWTEIGTATLWDIEYDTAGFVPTGIPTVSGVTNPYVITGLDELSTYDFYVRGDCDTSGVSMWVGPMSFTTTPMCPAIANIQVDSITPTTIEVSWTNLGYATLWDIEYDTAGFTPSGIPTEIEVSNPYTITGLTASTNYDIYVRANCGPNGTSVWIGPYSFNTECVPADIFVSGDEVCEGEIGLLLASSSNPAANFAWYTQAEGGAPFFEGDLLITDPVTQGATYYVSSVLGSTPVNNSIFTQNTGGNGCGGGNMFNITANYNIAIDSIAARFGSTATNASASIYYRTGTYLGNEMNATAWTLHATVTIPNVTGQVLNTIVLPTPLEVEAGVLTGIYVQFDAAYTTITAPIVYSNDDLELTVGSGLCSQFGGNNPNRAFNGEVFYRYGFGCESPRVPVTVELIPGPEVDLGGDVSLCDGQSLELNGPAGASSYLWTIITSSGTTTASSQNISVTESGTYSLLATNAAGCSATDEATITIVPALDYELETSATDVCEGESVTLTASGAGLIFSWSGGIENGVAFTPTETSTYILTVTDSLETCIIEESVTITVTEFITVTADASSTTVCAGMEVTLTGSGATNYEWSGGVENGVPFTISETTTFTVTGSTGSCSDTHGITITVNPLPEVTIDLPFGDTLCIEEGSVTLSGGSPAGGVWSGPGITGTTFDPAIPGEGLTEITYTFTDANGCAGSATVEVYSDICISTRDILLTNVSVFPNPFNQFVDIRWSQLPSNTAELRIMDVLGRTIAYHKLEEHEVHAGVFRLELDQLSAGSYFIELSSGNASFRQTILKTQ